MDYCIELLKKVGQQTNTQELAIIESAHIRYAALCYPLDLATTQRLGKALHSPNDFRNNRRMDSRFFSEFI